jgi:hypothetical protein
MKVEFTIIGETQLIFVLDQRDVFVTLSGWLGS